MASLFGAIAQDRSSHITASSIYSPYPPPLRSSRDRQPVALPTVLQSVRSSIYSLFSSNASTVHASTPPPLPQFNKQKPAPLVFNGGSQWTLPDFSFANEPDQPLSANFSHDAPLYEPHPVANYAPSCGADQSPRLDETHRAPVNYKPLTPRILSQLRPETSQSHGHGIQTPPAVYEFRQQSRSDLRDMMSDTGNRQSPVDGHRRQFSGADREELILCHEIDRRQQKHKEHHRKKSSESMQKGNRKKSSKKEKTWNGKYSPCFSSSKKRLRNKSIGCFATGGCLMIAVATYLALALSGTPLSSAGHILLILLIAGITLVFCHFLLSVARLAFSKPDKKSSSPSHAYNRRQHGHRTNQSRNLRDLEMQRDENGYAVPAQPVPIVFAGTNDVYDSQAQTSYYAPEYTAENTRQVTPNSPKIAPPPPAYGLWRESVRVDPSRIFWARNPHASSAAAVPAVHPDTLAMLEGRDGGSAGGERPALRRPPSYASDISALSVDEERRVERDTWGRERIEEAARVENEVQMLMVHPSLRR